ncbi:MAG: SDR family oxidoreductase [Candidatus Thorarchaeota archaeon]
MDPKGKVAIVTGASLGIGRAIALAFASRGMKVVLAARNEEKLQAVAKQIRSDGGDALVCVTDVTKEEQVRHLIGTTAAHYGTIDVLVNNAGVGRFKLIQDFSLDDYDFMFDVNVKGLFLCTKYAVPHLLDKKGEKEKGKIINIASIAGKTGFKYGTLYSATKFAVVGFTWSLREDLKEKGIAVSAICPGGVNTGFGDSPKSEFVEFALEPEDVAHAAMFLVEESDTANTRELELKPRYKPRKRSSA